MQSDSESEVYCFASFYSPGSAISDVEAQEHYDRFFEVCIFPKLKNNMQCEFLLWIAIAMCFFHFPSKNLLAQEINLLFSSVNLLF